MINALDISLADGRFHERITGKYENFSPHSPNLISPLSKKLRNYPHYPSSLTYFLPFIFKSSILNKNIQKSSSRSFYNNTLINLDFNLQSINYRLFESQNNDLKLFFSKSYKYIKKQLKQKNNPLKLNIKDVSFNTITNKTLNYPLNSEKHIHAHLKYLNKSGTTLKFGETVTTNNTETIHQLKMAKKHVHKYLKNLIDESASENITNSLLSTNIVLKKFNTLKNNYRLIEDNKTLSKVTHKESNDFNSPEIHAQELSYYSPDMEHLETFQSETVKEKILEKDQGFQDFTNSIPDIDVNKMADQVYSIIERKIKIERERRGLFV